MAYTIYNTDGTILLTMADNAIDNVATSLDLIGKNVNNYGQSFNNNMVKLLTNFASTPDHGPISPQVGQIWFDTMSNQLNVYDTSHQFVQIGGNGSTSAFSTSGFATITYVDTVVANSTMSFASSLQTLQTSFNTLDTKTSGSYTNLVSLISNSTATIVSQITTLSAKFDTLSGGTGATVQYVDQAVASSTASIASSLQTLQTDFTNLQTKTEGSYTNLVTLISDSTATISTRVNTLESTFSSLSGGTGATVQYVDQAIATSTSSFASSLQTLTSKVNGATATVATLSSTVDGISAQWGVTINNNGAVSGVRLLSGSDSLSTFVVSADSFQIKGTTAGSSVTPFLVDTANSEIILNAKLKSSSYSSGGSGWIIRPDGTFVFGSSSKNVTYDGSVLTINGDLITTGNIVTNAVTNGVSASSSDFYIYGPTQPVSVTIVPTGGKITVFYRGNVSGMPTGEGSNTALLTLSRSTNGGTDVVMQSSSLGAGAFATLNDFYVDSTYTVGATITYTVTASYENSSNNYSYAAVGAGISVLENKR